MSERETVLASLPHAGDYRTVVADPPWPIASRMGAGGRRRRPTVVPYPFMDYDEIAALPVAEIAADRALLFLWATRAVFREGVAARVARAWGFEPCGEVIWGLRNPGMGAGALVNDHEPVLIAARGGAVPEPILRGLGVVFWRQPYGKGKIHSAKPDGFLDLVEELSPEPRLELFARRARFGWETWGNESLGGGEAGSSLIGPERSEGPSLAPRRHRANPPGGRGCGHAEDTSCKSALFTAEPDTGRSLAYGLEAGGQR